MRQADGYFACITEEDSSLSASNTREKHKNVLTFFVRHIAKNV
jgi:hypothetical protein